MALNILEGQNFSFGAHLPDHREGKSVHVSTKGAKVTAEEIWKTEHLLYKNGSETWLSRKCEK